MRVRKELPEVKESQDETEGPTAMDVDSETLDDFNSRNKMIRNILCGELTIQLYLQFLHRNNHADLGILKTTRACLDSRHSVTHSAVIFANALMNAGTTRDAFLRDNLEWLSRATNWAKFSATAGLGVIHRGHLKEGLSLLAPYLPGSTSSASSSFSEGGALYALGLIHANHGGSILTYLRDALSKSQGDPVIQHGACLGLGTAGMATADYEIYEDLKGVLFLDDASAGEAAGLAMGLVMLGTAQETPISEMLAYAHETQHEKIIRGLAVGMSMIMYGREAQADALISQLLLDQVRKKQKTKTLKNNLINSLFIYFFRILFLDMVLCILLVWLIVVLLIIMQFVVFYILLLVMFLMMLDVLLLHVLVLFFLDNLNNVQKWFLFLQKVIIHTFDMDQHLQLELLVQVQHYQFVELFLFLIIFFVFLII